MRNVSAVGDCRISVLAGKKTYKLEKNIYREKYMSSGEMVGSSGVKTYRLEQTMGKNQRHWGDGVSQWIENL